MTVAQWVITVAIFLCPWKAVARGSRTLQGFSSVFGRRRARTGVAGDAPPFPGWGVCVKRLAKNLNRSKRDFFPSVKLFARATVECVVRLICSCHARRATSEGGPAVRVSFFVFPLGLPARARRDEQEFRFLERKRSPIFRRYMPLADRKNRAATGRGLRFHGPTKAGTPALRPRRATQNSDVRSIFFRFGFFLLNFDIHF